MRRDRTLRAAPIAVTDRAESAHGGLGTTDHTPDADIQAGPNGNLFVVSLSHGAIYETFRRK